MTLKLNWLALVAKTRRKNEWKMFSANWEETTTEMAQRQFEWIIVTSACIQIRSGISFRLVVSNHLIFICLVCSSSSWHFRMFWIALNTIYGSFHSKLNDRACVRWDESFAIHTRVLTHTHTRTLSLPLSHWNAMLWAIIIGHVKFLCAKFNSFSLSLSCSRSWKQRFEFHFIIIFGMEGKIDWQFVHILHRKFPSFDTHSNDVCVCLLATKSTSVFISICVNLPLNKDEWKKRQKERENV